MSVKHLPLCDTLSTERMPILAGYWMVKNSIAENEISNKKITERKLENNPTTQEKIEVFKFIGKRNDASSFSLQYTGY